MALGPGEVAEAADIDQRQAAEALRHLRDRGLATVLLYVDDDNPRAVRLYEGLGFTRYAVDVQFARR